MDVYTPTLVVLLIILTAVLFYQYKNTRLPLSTDSQDDVEKLDTLDVERSAESVADELTHFRSRFLQIYSLAIAADWLQGSFIYSLYRNTHLIAETTIAALFMTGFLSAGIGAFVAGAFADTFGRKRACLLYCGLYAVSCLLILSPNLAYLFVGRALGGLSTTLLFTAFESWMIGEYNRLGFGRCGGLLNSIFGAMSVLNGLIAIACGLVSQFLVKVTSSEKSPFLASIVCLVLAALLISTSWVENYGIRKCDSDTSPDGILSTIEPRLLIITYVVSVFEGSMYIMVFSWAGILASARSSEYAGNPPFGIIFAAFMCSLTLGSSMFTLATRNGNHSLQASSHAIQVALSFAASGLLLTVMAQREAFRFLALCLFEFSLGLYFPAVAYIKGVLVPEQHRAKIYGVMRIPLNSFVVFALSRVQDSDLSRENRLVACSGLLLIGIIFTARHMNPLDGVAQ